MKLLDYNYIRTQKRKLFFKAREFFLLPGVFKHRNLEFENQENTEKEDKGKNYDR